MALEEGNMDTTEEGKSELLPLSRSRRDEDERSLPLPYRKGYTNEKQSFEINPGLDDGFKAYDDVDTTQVPPWLNRCPKAVVEFFFPSNVPRSVQLFRRENIAIPLCYLFVGLVSLSNETSCYR